MFAMSPKPVKRAVRIASDPGDFDFDDPVIVDSDDDGDDEMLITDEKMNITESALAAVGEADTLLKEKFYMSNLKGVALSLKRLEDNSPDPKWEKVLLTLTPTELYITNVGGEVAKVPLWDTSTRMPSHGHGQGAEGETIKMSMPDISQYKRYILVLETAKFTIALTPMQTSKSSEYSDFKTCDVISMKKKISELCRTINSAVTQAESYMVSEELVTSFYEQIRLWEEKYRCQIASPQSLEYIEDLQRIASAVLDLRNSAMFKCDVGCMSLSARDRLITWKVPKMLMKIFSTYTVNALQNSCTSVAGIPSLKLIHDMTNCVLTILMHLVSQSDQHKKHLLHAIGNELVQVISKVTLTLTLTLSRSPTPSLTLSLTLSLSLTNLNPNPNPN